MSQIGSTALERQIRSQPDELERLLVEPIPHDVLERIRQARRLWLVGTGTSLHAAELGALMFYEVGRAAQAVSSMRFVNWAPPIDPQDCVVLISHNAGLETAYAAAAWTLGKDAGLRVVPITRRGGELPEALETVAKETSQTHTVSYTAVLLLLARVVHALGLEEFGPPVLARIPEAVQAAIDAPGVESIPQPGRLLLLAGEGPAAITAREGALKLREASRLAAEGYDVEYLLHGSAVPLGPSDRLLALSPPDTDGLVEAVSRAAEAEGVPVTRLHESAELPAVLAQIPLTVRLQLLALRLAEERGHDPDRVIEGAWDDGGLWAIGAPGPSR